MNECTAAGIEEGHSCFYPGYLLSKLLGIQWEVPFRWRGSLPAGTLLLGWRDTRDRSNGNRLDSARAERIRAGNGTMIAN
jgi:hypothetical protein